MKEKKLVSIWNIQKKQFNSYCAWQRPNTCISATLELLLKTRASRLMATSAAVKN